MSFKNSIMIDIGMLFTCNHRRRILHASLLTTNNHLNTHDSCDMLLVHPFSFKQLFKLPHGINPLNTEEKHPIKDLREYSQISADLWNLDLTTFPYLPFPSSLFLNKEHVVEPPISLPGARKKCFRPLHCRLRDMYYSG